MNAPNRQAPNAQRSTFKVQRSTKSPIPLPKSEIRNPRERASVLVIVLWVAFGIVSLALYFAHTMRLELRAADNRVAALEAEHAIAGAARYLSNVLASLELPGVPPDPETYWCDEVPVGDATFWLVGRGDWENASDLPVFGLVDEASKLNLNTATLEMLEMLPNMPVGLAAAIIDWRDEDSTVTEGGAEDETYQRLDPPYRCKNAPFESIDELRLVYGTDLLTLFGEDANRNGILDPNEDDGDASYPYDNRDGRLDPGILEYVTVYSRESTLRASGTSTSTDDSGTSTNTTSRVNVSGSDQENLASLLQESFGVDRANEILLTLGYSQSPGGGGAPGGGTAGSTNATGTITFGSVLEFYVKSGMTAEEFDQIAGDITTSSSGAAEGLVNVNTASEAVLVCIPGIGLEHAASLVAQRQSNPLGVASFAWVVDVLGQTNAVEAGAYLTAFSYQYTADIAAVGHEGRGYQRVRFVFDTRDGTPRILYRQDLSHLGWALGSEVRQTLRLARERRS